MVNEALLPYQRSWSFTLVANKHMSSVRISSQQLVCLNLILYALAESYVESTGWRRCFWVADKRRGVLPLVRGVKSGAEESASGLSGDRRPAPLKGVLVSQCPEDVGVASAETGLKIGDGPAVSQWNLIGNMSTLGDQGREIRDGRLRMGLPPVSQI